MPVVQKDRDLNDTLCGASPYSTPNEIGDTYPSILFTGIFTPSDSGCHSPPFLTIKCKEKDGMKKRGVFNIVHRRTVPAGANVMGGSSLPRKALNLLSPFSNPAFAFEGFKTGSRECS